MNGIEKITARIEAEAAADAARIAEEAKVQADVIRAEGEKKAQESYWQKVQEGVKAAEDRVSRLGKAANMESRKSILNYKQVLVAEAFRLAEERLAALPEEKYVEFLAGQAARAAVTGKEELLLNEKDRSAVGEKTLAKANELLKKAGKTGALTLSDETGSFAGGVVLRDGDISVNCTVEALMAEARESMASRVAAELLN